MDRVGRRAAELRAEQENRRAEDTQSRLREKDRQRQRAAAAARLPEMLEMSGLRQIFLSPVAKEVLREERVRLALERWYETRCGALDQLTDTFREWAIRAHARDTVPGGWLISTTQSIRHEDNTLPGDRFPIHKPIYQRTHLFIEREPREQPPYSKSRTIEGIRVYRSESEIKPNPRYPIYLPPNLDHARPLTIEVRDDQWFLDTRTALEEGMADWVARYPSTPWPGEADY